MGRGRGRRWEGEEAVRRGTRVRERRKVERGRGGKKGREGGKK